MSKKISVMNAANGELIDVDLSPGTTVRDLKEHLDLESGWEITRKGDPKKFPDTLDLYDETRPDDLLLMASGVHVG